MIEFAHIPLKDFIKKYNPQEPKKGKKILKKK